VRQSIAPAQHCWLSAQIERPEYGFLVESALQLEPIICNEAASEQAIGQQWWFLMLHRIRTTTDFLHTRTPMEDRQNQGQRNAIPSPMFWERTFRKLLSAFDFLETN
jgi:hypothetical protein